MMFEFENPWLFGLLVLPIVVYIFSPLKQSVHRGAIWVPFYNRLSTFQQASITTAITWRSVLLCLIWIALVCAASGPQWVGDPLDVPIEGRSLMLAVDISGSMRLRDMIVQNEQVDRLSAVKHVARPFIEKRVGDRIGLIVFGTRAYLQTPLTFDRQTVSTMLDDATIGLAGPKTAIGDAIGLAIKRLEKSAAKSRALILLSDGSANAGVLRPLQAADLAARSHIKIYTIGLGSDSAMISSIFGPRHVNPSMGLDEKTMKEIAMKTGGQYFRAKNVKALQSIYKTIDRLEPSNQKVTLLRPTKPLYYYPLLLALLLSVFLCFSPLQTLSRTRQIS